MKLLLLLLLLLPHYYICCYYYCYYHTITSATTTTAITTLLHLLLLLLLLPHYYICCYYYCYYYHHTITSAATATTITTLLHLLLLLLLLLSPHYYICCYCYYYYHTITSAATTTATIITTLTSAATTTTTKTSTPVKQPISGSSHWEFFLLGLLLMILHSCQSMTPIHVLGSKAALSRKLAELQYTCTRAENCGKRNYCTFEPKFLIQLSNCLSHRGKPSLAAASFVSLFQITALAPPWWCCGSVLMLQWSYGLWHQHTGVSFSVIFNYRYHFLWISSGKSNTICSLTIYIITPLYRT